MAETPKLSYYYWDPEFKTEAGLTLKQCLERYGTQKVNAKSFYYKVIFLDKKKDLGNSWMLWSKDYRTNSNIKVTQYEKDPTHIVYGDI
jgi:hypothetical protein